MATKFSIRKVLEHYTGAVIPERGSGWTQIHCPVHDEQRPSASYNEDLGKVHCFGCTFHGDALDLIKVKEGVEDYSEQVKIAEAITGDTIDGASGLVAAPARRLPMRITDGGAPAAVGGAPRPAPAARAKRRRRI